MHFWIPRSSRGMTAYSPRFILMVRSICPFEGGFRSSSIPGRFAAKLNKKKPERSFLPFGEGGGKKRTSGDSFWNFRCSTPDRGRLQHHPQEVDVIYLGGRKNYFFPLELHGGLRMITHDRSNRIVFQQEKNPTSSRFHFQPHPHLKCPAICSVSTVQKLT